MAVVELKRDSHNDKGKTFSQTITLTPSGVSDDIVFPDDYLKDIGISWDSGTPTVEFTFSDRAHINANTAQWITWDNTSIINKAARAVRITNPEVADMEVVVSVRTR